MSLQWLTHTRVLFVGSGDPHFDSFEANPFESRKQRREAEVKTLLHKLQPDMIDLDTSHIGTLARDHTDLLEVHRQTARDANASTTDAEDPAKPHKKRPKSSTLRRYLKKQDNVIDARKQAVRERLEREKRERQQAQAKKPARKPSILDRFKRTEEAS